MQSKGSPESGISYRRYFLFSLFLKLESIAFHSKHKCFLSLVIVIVIKIVVLMHNLHIPSALPCVSFTRSYMTALHKEAIVYASS